MVGFYVFSFGDQDWRSSSFTGYACLMVEDRSRKELAKTWTWYYHTVASAHSPLYKISSYVEGGEGEYLSNSNTIYYCRQDWSDLAAAAAIQSMN